MQIRSLFAWVVCFFATMLFLSAVRAQELDSASDAARWLRYPAISPDGKTIVYAYHGHLFTVPSFGGEARALTASGSGALETTPVWSADSKWIAFASDRYGNFDVFVIPAQGGTARRLTTHSNDEFPTSFSPDGKSVLFSAHRMDARSNAQFPSARLLPELYRVSVEPGREPEQILTTPALAARFDRDGKRLVYEDVKGYENPWRKHETFANAHDIWLFDQPSGTHTRLTNFAGEDRDPVWDPSQRAIWYLSEASGSFNVWQLSLEDTPDARQPRQITRFEKHPLRFLSIAEDKTLCFTFDGDIYTLKAGGAALAQPRKVEVRVGTDTAGRNVEAVNMSEGATEIALNPDGKEIAFVARGEVFVSSVEHGITKRVTNTPGQERSVSFSPDGRKLLFAGETDHAWSLFEASLTRSKEAEPYFFNSTLLEVRTLLDNGLENFQPRYSPDGKEVAYLENRTALRVLNLDSKQTRLVVPGDRSYSYSDGDQAFDWSPDGKWLLVQFLDPHRWSNEVGLVASSGNGAALTDVTNSGYEDRQPVWSLGGKAMIWFSNRDGLHGDDGNGGGPQSDVYAMFFTQKAFDRFKLNKAENELAKRAEDEEKKKKEKEKTDAAKNEADSKDKNKTDDKEKKPEPVPAVELDLKNLEDRIVRLTINSTRLVDAAMTPDGEALIYLAHNEEGYELWQNKFRDKDTKRIAFFEGSGAGDGHDGDAQLLLDKEGKLAFVLAGGKIFKVTLGDTRKQERVGFNAEMTLDRAAERAALFEHVWRQAREKFYVADLHGVDWDFYKNAYAKFLPFIDNNRDFAELLSEMLGELNASHTGARFAPRPRSPDDTAALGAFFDPAWRGLGLRVEEIIEKGPLAAAGVNIAPGMVIEKIDGVVLASGVDISPLLNRKAGKPTLLAVFDPAKNARFDTVMKPIRQREQEELLYRRWVKSRREAVDKLSGGRLGYVHVRSMDDHSYREAFSEILGRQSGKEALIVDTRFNGGGNLHDDLAKLLAGKAYFQWVPRGRVIGEEPTSRWNRRSVLIVGEGNYSDAHLFPATYRALELGKIVGMPVPGTGTFVWWETLQDPTLVFGIPQVGVRDFHGNLMERTQLEPDVRVENDPASVARGEDKQLAAAVRELLAPAGTP